MDGLLWNSSDEEEKEDDKEDDCEDEKEDEQTEAGQTFVAMITDMVLNGTVMSAKHAGILCYWAARAGVHGPAQQSPHTRGPRAATSTPSSTGRLACRKALATSCI